MDDIKLFYSIENKNGSLPLRIDIEEKYKWDTTHIFSSDELWEEKFSFVENLIDNFKSFEGRLGESAEKLLSFLKFDEEIGTSLEQLYLYAMLKKDEDLNESKYQLMEQKIKSLYTKATAASSFALPELLSLSEEKLNSFKGDDKLSTYRHYFEELILKKPHTLSKEEEKIVALSGEVTTVPYEAFSMFTNADLKFDEVEDDSGKMITMSHGRYYSALSSKDRAYRERAYKAYYKPFKEYAKTFSVILNGNIKSNIFYARVKKYTSALEAALKRNNISTEVYTNLIRTVSDNLSPMHRWAELKAKVMKLEKLNPFDTYVELFEVDSEKKYSFEEACQLVLNSCKPLGEDYVNNLKTAFNNRWIDVFETKGKRSGAYSSGTTYGVHPYVLMNWNNQLNDVFTLAHEMGHNMHSYYTGNHQPYIYANYTIFLAEVASTLNESLLLDYLIQQSKNANEKLALMEKFLNNITTTFYRQTMFAEFEKLIYEYVESGNALTVEFLCENYKSLYQKYWGDKMLITEEETFTWARIPHFYYNFYVFQYATGFAASEAISNLVKNEGDSAIQRYLRFLKSGSSNFSLDLLKAAGVDMLSDQPVISTTEKMNQILNEMEIIINNSNGINK